MKYFSLGISICILLLTGCAPPVAQVQPEVPGLQQYYQMPGPYYTAPPPQLEYWDPRQDPLWQQEQALQNEKDNLRKSRLQKRRELWEKI